MKRIVVITLIMFVFETAVAAHPINAAAYSVMQKQSYRNNYHRQVGVRPMPYWQAPSNFTTRNRMNFHNNNFYNSINNYNPYMIKYRGY